MGSIVFILIIPFVTLLSWTAVLFSIPDLLLYASTLLFAVISMVLFIVAFMSWRHYGWRLRWFTKITFLLALLSFVILFGFLAYALKSISFFGRSVFYLSISLISYYSTLSFLWLARLSDVSAYIDVDLSSPEALLETVSIIYLIFIFLCFILYCMIPLYLFNPLYMFYLLFIYSFY